MSAQLAKPKLRALYAAQLKRNIIASITAGVIIAGLFKVFVCDKRKQKYVDFYKTYDPEKQLKIMNEAGLMQSYIPK
ncbi:Cytochrome c oxidase polypeptide VIc [Camponotus floridanus]|uniref:Cytochrome c oxidase polypeptide VIc n=1 Tax=Camponotus floridanus TaxID=104421 RepID=E2AXV3_CAMFO|nr:Cytochrome c oxidase polypeptide VIc [Camponotus floridanus]